VRAYFLFVIYFLPKPCFVVGKKMGDGQTLDSAHHFICYWWMGAMQHKLQQKRAREREKQVKQRRKAMNNYLN
jgi:hypothetical protein